MEGKDWLGFLLFSSFLMGVRKLVRHAFLGGSGLDLRDWMDWIGLDWMDWMGWMFREGESVREGKGRERKEVGYRIVLGFWRGRGG